MDRDTQQDRQEVKRAREEAAERAKRKQDEIDSAIRRLISNPDFVLIMAHFLSLGGMFRSVMTGNSWSYHASGRQDLAREMWARLAKVDRDRAFNILKPTYGDESNG